MSEGNNKFWNVETMRMFIAVATLMASNFGFEYYISSDLERRMNERFDRIEVRLEEIDERLDSFGERIAKNEARLMHDKQ